MKLFINKKVIVEEAQRPEGSLFRKEMKGNAPVKNPFRSRLAKNIQQERIKSRVLNKKADNMEKNIPTYPSKFEGYLKTYNTANENKQNEIKQRVSDLRNRADTHRKRAGVISSTNSLRHTAGERAAWLNKKMPSNLNPDTIALPTGGIQHWNDLTKQERQNIYNKNSIGRFNPSQMVYHNTNDAIRERINANIEPLSFYSNDFKEPYKSKSNLERYDPNKN